MMCSPEAILLPYSGRGGQHSTDVSSLVCLVVVDGNILCRLAGEEGVEYSGGGGEGGGEEEREGREGGGGGGGERGKGKKHEKCIEADGGDRKSQSATEELRDGSWRALTSLAPPPA